MPDKYKFLCELKNIQLALEIVQISDTTHVKFLFIILYLDSGLADIIGRRFGSHKLPYNRNKSIAGSIAMMTAGFIASVG